MTGGGGDGGAAGATGGVGLMWPSMGEKADAKFINPSTIKSIGQVWKIEK
ncbi:MAG TPA: hypothetical protein VE545_09215 [Candidatus Dormibacteraeota bacterium]|nr:hypothetical protein [Candidatus Dormibacteraeota bacterium]